MKNKQNLLIVILTLVIVLGLAGLAYQRLGGSMAPDQLATQPQQTQDPSDPDQETQPKVQVPDFTVYDREGNEVSLSSLFGKPIVLNFWASWCGPCKMEMPDFDRAYQEIGEDVHFVMVNATVERETKESAEKFLTENGYSFPVYFDLDGTALQTYGIFSFPTTYFIDAEGYGVAMAKGAISAEMLQQGLDMIYQK